MCVSQFHSVESIYEGYFEFREVTPNRAALDRGHSARQTEISRRGGIISTERGAIGTDFPKFKVILVYADAPWRIGASIPNT